MNSAYARLATPLPTGTAPGWLARLRAAWPRAGTRPSAQSVTALMLGHTRHAVRVSLPREAGGLLSLQAAAPAAFGSDTAALAAWKAAKLFKSSQPLLVLRTAERQLLTIDQPQVPAAELAMAARWPLAEAMECDAEALLATAVALPRINDAQRTQVLAVGARIEPVRAQLAACQQAGVKLRAIDIVDSALRGMALLARRAVAESDEQQAQASVVLASVGSDICIGLIQHGRFCALRTLALPGAAPRDAAAFEEQLALHIQRTTDTFERQATQLAVRRVLALLPAIEPAMREPVRQMLPLQARWFEPEQVFRMDRDSARHLQDHDELAALACVAAARLLEPATAPAESEVAA